MPELYGKYACSSRGSVIPRGNSQQRISSESTRETSDCPLQFACGWTDFVPQPLGSITRHRERFEATECLLNTVRSKMRRMIFLGPIKIDRAKKAGHYGMRLLASRRLSIKIYTLIRKTHGQYREAPTDVVTADQQHQRQQVPDKSNPARSDAGIDHNGRR